MGFENGKWTEICNFGEKFLDSVWIFGIFPQLVMKEYPESEIQLKFFADAGEKRSENLAKNFADFCPLISRKSGRKKFHKKSSTFSTRDETKFFHREILGGGCPNS